MYIELYPSKESINLKDGPLRVDMQSWLTSLFDDPITLALMKNSHLTRIQSETFLIDILAEKIGGRTMIYERKAKLRLLKSGVSRGAFNRTLAQARRNIIKSIYTLILLGYLGVFENPCLDPYVEIANKIRTFTEAYKDAWKSKRVDSEHIRVISMLQREIERSLKDLSGVESLSRRT